MEWHIIPTGRVWVEPGGAMGLVPRPLWIEHQPVDEHHRTPMDLNSLLVLTGNKKILIWHPKGRIAYQNIYHMIWNSS